MSDNPSINSASRRTGCLVLLAALVAMSIQWAIATRGTFHTLPAAGNHYAQLAGAFAQGCLSFTTPPPDGLLALADPYDALANQPFREAGLHDLILREGKLYLYLGPAPAAVAWGIQRAHLRSDDAAIATALAIAFTVALAALMLQLAHRRWISPLAAACGVLLGALCLPATWQLARPANYEAAILAGQFALTLALICRVWAVGSPHAWRWLALASLCAGLAAMSRVSLVPALCAVAGLDVLWRWVSPVATSAEANAIQKGRRRRRGDILQGLATILPLAACVLLLLAYNHARFGDVRESGIRWMLASQRGRAGLDTQPFSAHYLVKNSINYALAVPKVKNGPALGNGFPAFRKEAYTADRVAGVAWSVPAWALAAAGLWRLRKRFVGVLATVLIVLAALPWMMFFYCAERYLLDIGLVMTVLSAIGLTACGRRRTAVAIGLVTLSVLIGVGFAAIGYV